MVLAALLGLSSKARAEGATLQKLVVSDVLGEPVRLGPPEQHGVAIVYLMSRSSGEASAAFARAVDERLLRQPVDAIAIVDVRRFGGLLRGLTLSRMRSSERESRERRRTRRIAGGVGAAEEMANRWHLLADFDGALFARFGVGAEPTGPIAFLVDPAGAVSGPYADPDTLCAAFARLSGATPSASSPDSRRPSMER